MTKRIERLLSSLREAIHDALGDSNGVASALAELEREGRSPDFSVGWACPKALSPGERSQILRRIPSASAPRSR